MESIIRLEPGGQWHRRSQVVTLPPTTACGCPLDRPIATRDRMPHDNNLCPVCFSRQEIDTGKLHRIARELEKSSDPELYFDPDDDPTPVDSELPAGLKDDPDGGDPQA